MKTPISARDTTTTLTAAPVPTQGSLDTSYGALRGKTAVYQDTVFTPKISEAVP
ncbi:MAG TPA: hypothetical protein PLL36_02495 [Candidatus Hydrogenedentes bacterium]|nr:hypothetical protein [Candidatus Hydrogenedentota bacterium]HQM99911.1 hypothetical protein [Candidatus Hydrogenedentota bacterium]